MKHKHFRNVKLELFYARKYVSTQMMCKYWIMADGSLFSIFGHKALTIMPKMEDLFNH